MSTLHVVALEHRRLTNDALSQLQAVRIPSGDGTSQAEAFRSRAQHPVDDVIVIEKCNAVIVAATVSMEADDEFLRDRILAIWLDLAPGLERYVAKVAHYSGRQAIEYLGEVSVGLRSVVLGDAQVFAQVTDGLSEARGAADQSSPFAVLTRRLRALLQLVRSGTTLQQGNISLERVGCERLIAQLGRRRATVAVVGLGRTGLLMADILSKETPYHLIITNRTASRVPLRRFPTSDVFAWNDLSFLDQTDAVLLCLADNTETEAFARKLVEQLDPHRAPQQLLVDMSSPSITRALPGDLPATVVRIDQLSQDATGNLSSRKQAVNKAKQMISDWAGAVERQLDAVSARDRAAPGDEPDVRVSAGPASPRSAMLKLLRDHLARQGFLEVQTSCLGAPGIDLASAGPGRALEVPCSSSGAVLRPSVQLYRQMALLRDLHRIYEIGPFWRTEDEHNPRHLVELQALAVELVAPPGPEALCTLVLELVTLVVDRLQPLDGRPSLSVPSADRVPVLTYDQAITMLRDAGYRVPYGADLGYELTYFLGDLVRRRHGLEILIVRDHPDVLRKPHAARAENGRSTRTFGVILDGWEIATGGLRETDPRAIRKRIILAGARPDQDDRYLADLAGGPSHGGFELGLDWLLARVLRCDTVRDVARSRLV